MTNYSWNTGKNTDEFNETGRNGGKQDKIDQTICAIILANIQNDVVKCDDIFGQTLDWI